MEQTKYKLDGRSKEELLREFEKLCESYVPEWKYDHSDPDIGETLARIFAGQLSMNLEAYNEILERYHTAFVNLLDISLGKAIPSETIVLLKLLSDSVPGVFIDKKTRFLAETSEGNCYFEAEHPLYVTSSRLDSAFMSIEPEGKVVPLYGSFTEKDYAGNPVHHEAADEEEAPGELKGFTLFDPKAEGIEKQALLLYHNRIFDVTEEELFVKIEGNEELKKDILLGKYRFLYYTEEGFIPVESVKLVNKTLVLVKEKESARVKIDQSDYGMLVLEAMEPVKECVTVKDITFSSNGRLRMPEYVGNGNTDYEVSGFNLFTDTLSNYAECYIGMDPYFSKQKAKISLKFNISFLEHAVGFSQQEETGQDENLKIIKRRTGSVQTRNAVVYAGCDEICIEYYNGIGWKRLACERDYRNMFADSVGGEGELSFICPGDWEETTVGAYQGRALKITLVRSDNCYARPCIHRYPVLTNMTVEYSYEQRYERPQKAVSLFGTASADITGSLCTENECPIFRKGNYNESALYLGFTKPFEAGPVSLWWKLKDTHRMQNRRIHISYSSSKGFKEMKFIDHTGGLCKNGTMLFLPPDDMTSCELENRRLFWLKLTDEERTEYEPVEIERIELNAVELKNIYTHEEQSLFIDSVKANTQFDLNAQNILDADVWVNELSELTKEQMELMLAKEPERVRAGYNYLGEPSEFFVKWEERDNFNNSEPKDRHYMIDRVNSKLIFGDGNRVRIPRNTTGTAILVTVRSCDGSLGNVEAGTITASDRNLLYVGEISNPEPAFGGSNMESMARALKRGVNLLSSGQRFVTLSDYREDILNYSDAIDKASVIVGTDRNANEDRKKIHIAVLMKDYQNGPASFYRMQTALCEHLLEHCELSVAHDELIVEEPVFVELNTEIWAKTDDIDESFEVRSSILEMLEDYLSPLSSAKSKGRQIGEIPGKAQLLMKLNTLKSKAVIRQIMITASYHDSKGYHEADISELKPTPYMVAISGTHKVHLSKTGQN